MRRPCLPFKMRTLKNLCLLIIVISISIKINAQKLELTALKRIDPYTIIASNFKSMPDCSISNNISENGIYYQIIRKGNFPYT